MNKERELLKEALYVIGEFTEDAQERGEILITEIKELLAQPEQAELLDILEEIIADLKLIASFH